VLVTCTKSLFDNTTGVHYVRDKVYDLPPTPYLSENFNWPAETKALLREQRAKGAWGAAVVGKELKQVPKADGPKTLAEAQGTKARTAAELHAEMEAEKAKELEAKKASEAAAIKAASEKDLPKEEDPLAALDEAVKSDKPSVEDLDLD
jgi:hypothetical protein